MGNIFTDRVYCYLLVGMGRGLVVCAVIGGDIVVGGGEAVVGGGEAVVGGSDMVVGGAVGGGTATRGAPLHTVTSFNTVPSIGWISSAGRGEEDSVPKAEFGPDRGRLGSVNTALNSPRVRGMFRGPCFEPRSPTLQARSESVEHKFWLLGEGSNIGRPSQELGLVTTPFLKLQLKGTNPSPPTSLLLRGEWSSIKDRFFLLLEGDALGIGVRDEGVMVTAGTRVEDAMGIEDSKARTSKEEGEGIGEERVLDTRRGLS